MTQGRPDGHALSGHQRDLLRTVHEHLPELVVESVSGISGQFNDVLILNDDVVVRFPRTDDAAKVLAVEIAVLRELQGHVPIPVPSPLTSALADDVRRPSFMGYRMLPGRPLDRKTLDTLWQFDRPVIERLGQQAGAFLRVLHTLPIDSFGTDVPLSDDEPFWWRMLDA